MSWSSSCVCRWVADQNQVALMAAQGTISGTQMGAWGAKQAKPRGKIGAQARRKRKLIKLPRAQICHHATSRESEKGATSRIMGVQKVKCWGLTHLEKEWQTFFCTLITPKKGVDSVSAHFKFLELMRFDQQVQNIEALPVLYRALFVFW